MDVGTTLLILAILAVGFGLIRLRHLWAEWSAFQAWRRAYAANAGEVLAAVEPPSAPAPQGEPWQALNRSAEVLQQRAPSHDVVHQRMQGTYRADHVRTFDVPAPASGEIVKDAGCAMANPPHDLRISIAEMDRAFPHLQYSFPTGWFLSDRAVPTLTTMAFVDDAMHVLVTGQTGSGKDSMINNWLLALAYRYGPEQLQFALVDGKNGLSVRGWYAKAHTWLFARHADEISNALEAIRAERIRREQVLWDAHCESWEEYRAITPKPFPLLVVYVSELLVLESVVGKTALADWLNVELTSCRAAGIRFIIGCQNVTRMDTRWRSQVNLCCAGYQQSDDADEPNTGLSTRKIREYGLLANQTLIAVPPSALPVPTAGGAGMFTLVQGRTVVTVRAPYLTRAQREWWFAQLPERPQGSLPIANRQWSDAVAPVEDATPAPWEADAAPEAAPSRPTPMLDLGYDLRRVRALINDPKLMLKDLPDNAVFVHACAKAYQRLGSYQGVVKELWDGSTSGPREKAVKEAILRAQGTEPDDRARTVASAA